jgi:hypothetical protein
MFLSVQTSNTVAALSNNVHGRLELLFDYLADNYTGRQVKATLGDTFLHDSLRITVEIRMLNLCSLYISAEMEKNTGLLTIDSVDRVNYWETRDGLVNRYAIPIYDNPLNIDSRNIPSISVYRLLYLINDIRENDTNALEQRGGTSMRCVECLFIGE